VAPIVFGFLAQFVLLGMCKKDLSSCHVGRKSGLHGTTKAVCFGETARDGMRLSYPDVVSVSYWFYAVKRSHAI
jgi:hypothetical protein